MTIYNTRETMNGAVSEFYLDRPGKPRLVPFGMGPIDRAIGGLGPGSCAILAAATGVGKSSTMLSAMLSSPVKVGSISLEDTRDIVGSRILSALSGIDSMRIRRKDLSKTDLKNLCNVATSGQADHMYFAYPTAGSIEMVEQSIAELCEAGCKMIWVDYIQEIRGHHDDRRNEVAAALSRCHRAAAAGDAALVAISQFHRMKDDSIPNIHNLAESGDLERKARVIILAHRVKDPEGADRVRYRVGKSTFGGEHIRWDCVRDESGTLREVELLDYTKEF